MTRQSHVAWLPITRPPRHPRLVCVSCDATAVNEDRSLAGWQVSAYGLVRFRCPTCAEVVR